MNFKEGKIYRKLKFNRRQHNIYTVLGKDSLTLCLRNERGRHDPYRDEVK